MSNLPVVFYFTLLLSSIPALIALAKIIPPTRTTVVCLLLGMLTYACLSIQITNLELWGDEINVIHAASLPFSKISGFVFRNHAASLPLDYWNLKSWLFIANPLSFPNREFLIRIPYMGYHLLASLFFSTLLAASLTTCSPKTKNFSHLTSFFLYFFNPLLFAYSMEVKFYSLAALGTVITLVLYQKNLLAVPKFIPILLLFSLNSVFQVITIMSIALFSPPKKNLLFPAFLCLSVYLITQQFLHIPPPVPSPESLKLISSAVTRFYQLQFNTLPQQALALLSFFLILRAGHLRLLISFVTSILTISFSAFLKGYFDFFPRHYHFTIPILLLLFLLPNLKSPALRTCWQLLLLFILILPWAKFITAQVATDALFSKFPSRARYFFSLAQAKNSPLVFAPPSKEAPSPQAGFILLSFKWYSQFFPHTPLISPHDPHSFCDYVSTHPSDEIFYISPNYPGCP